MHFAFDLERLCGRRKQIPAEDVEARSAVAKTGLINGDAVLYQRFVDGNRGLADFLAFEVEQFQIALEQLGLPGRIMLDAEILQLHHKRQILHQITIVHVQKHDIRRTAFRNLHAAPKRGVVGA